MEFLQRFSRYAFIPVLLGWRCPLLLEPSPYSTADICEKVLPSVFRIISLNPHTKELQGLGSGFFIKKDGTGLTAHHVLSSSNSFIAKLNNGEEYPLQVLNSHSLSDIALVKVKVPKSVPFLVLGKSEHLRRGEQVIHFGNTLLSTTTDIDIGYINKLKEDSPAWIDLQRSEGIDTSGISYIMTSGCVRPGFSGGPLVNMNGEVVGLISRLYIRNQHPVIISEGASIPIDYVKAVVKQMEISGDVKKPYFGFTFTTGNPGLLVLKVQTGSPAEKAGMKIGDLLVRANGRDIAGPEDLYAEAGFQIGVVIQFQAIRDEKNISLTVHT